MIPLVQYVGYLVTLSVMFALKFMPQSFQTGGGAMYATLGAAVIICIVSFELVMAVLPSGKAAWIALRLNKMTWVTLVFWSVVTAVIAMTILLVGEWVLNPLRQNSVVVGAQVVGFLAVVGLSPVVLCWCTEAYAMSLIDGYCQVCGDALNPKDRPCRRCTAAMLGEAKG